MLCYSLRTNFFFQRAFAGGGRMANHAKILSMGSANLHNSMANVASPTRAQTQLETSQPKDVVVATRQSGRLC